MQQTPPPPPPKKKKREKEKSVCVGGVGELGIRVADVG